MALEFGSLLGAYEISGLFSKGDMGEMIYAGSFGNGSVSCCVNTGIRFSSTGGLLKCEYIFACSFHCS